MRQGTFLEDKFFSLSGITDTFFPSRADFQEPPSTTNDYAELQTNIEGAWTPIENHTAIPCAMAPEVQGRPASSPEYKSSGDAPGVSVEADYLYVVLKGYWPALQKRWRIVVDGIGYTSSPDPIQAEADVWGIESDSQHTFTRLRVYRQRY